MGLSRFDRELRMAVHPRTASELMADGVSRYALRGPEWVQTSRGRYVPAGVASATATQRIIEAAAAIPTHATITGWAALYAHGVDGVDGLTFRDGKAVTVPVPVIWGVKGGDGGSQQVRVLHEPVAASDRQPRAGIAMVAPERATFDEVRLAGDIEQAVAVADAVTQARVATVPALRSYVDDHPGWRRVNRPGGRWPWSMPPHGAPWSHVCGCSTSWLPGFRHRSSTCPSSTSRPRS
jgi:hypothetical protein